MPDTDERPPPIQPTGPTEHLETVEYWRGLYLDAIAVGRDMLTQARDERDGYEAVLIAVRAKVKEAMGECGTSSTTHHRLREAIAIMDGENMKGADSADEG